MSAARGPANSLSPHQRVGASLGVRARRHPLEDSITNVPELTTNGSKTVKTICFPRADGSRIPYEVYSSPEIYEFQPCGVRCTKQMVARLSWLLAGALAISRSGR